MALVTLDTLPSPRFDVVHWQDAQFDLLGIIYLIYAYQNVNKQCSSCSNNPFKDSKISTLKEFKDFTLTLLYLKAISFSGRFVQVINYFR